MLLSIPRQRDPAARLALLVATGLVAWIGVTQAVPAAQAERPQVILIATPTLPIATEAPTAVPVVLQAAPTMAPVLAEQLPTPEPPQPVIQQVVVEAPVYIPIAADAPAADPPPIAEVGSAEYQQSVMDVYKTLPTVQCPCDPSPADEVASHDYQQRRLDAGNSPKTR